MNSFLRFDILNVKKIIIVYIVYFVPDTVLNTLYIMHLFPPANTIIVFA